MGYFEEEYKRKLVKAADIAGMIRSGDICACPTATGQPGAVVEAVAERARRGEIERVTHHSIIAVQPAPYAAPSLKGKYDYVSWFTTPAVRKSVQAGVSDYMPMNYSEMMQLWNERHLDVFYACVTPMDENGYFSFGLTASENVELAEKADRVYLQVNRNMPRVPGSNIIHISQTDAVCEADTPLDVLPEAPVTELDLKIGAMIAEQIPDGATVQFGIGGIPNAVGKCLEGKRDIGIHTELFTDSMVDLVKKGIVNNSRKNLNRGKSVAAFAWGSQRMYDFLKDNMAVELHPVSYVNNPYTIGQIDDFISINSCIEVDLLGQVCAESIGTKHFSGSGGQLDFVRGCNMSKGGKSFIAISSTAKGGSISKIKPILTPGAAVTTGKNDVDSIVTEYGIARLRGKTAGERAKALIAIAHPDFREELLFQARKMNLVI